VSSKPFVMALKISKDKNGMAAGAGRATRKLQAGSYFGPPSLLSDSQAAEAAEAIFINLNTTDRQTNGLPVRFILT